jgi:F0F1-type ATP synthase assembly protein I
VTDRSNEEREQIRKERAARRQGQAYQGAFEAVVAILIAAGIGWWIDSRFETSPWGLLIGTAIGFGSFVLRLLRMGRLLQELNDEEAAEDAAND